VALKNTSESYGVVAKGFHWFVAIIVFIMLPLGFLMDSIPPLHAFLNTAHKSLGITVLAIMVLRLLWKLSNKSPNPPKDSPVAMVVMAKLMIAALYVALFVMPLSGWIMSTASGHVPLFFGIFMFPIPGVSLGSPLLGLAHETHDVMAWIIIALVLVHTAAAFYHHFVRRDNVLLRMLPCSKKSNQF
jgi:cytochrome b561